MMASCMDLSFGLAAVAASTLHWFRFHVPITIAAFAAGLVAIATTLVTSVNETLISTLSRGGVHAAWHCGFPCRHEV